MDTLKQIPSGTLIGSDTIREAINKMYARMDNATEWRREAQGKGQVAIASFYQGRETAYQDAIDTFKALVS